jgi:hypothetical protein
MAAQQKAQRQVMAEIQRLKEKIASGERKRADLFERRKIEAAARRTRSEQLKEVRLNRQRTAAIALRARLQAIQSDCPLLTLEGVDDDPPQLFRVSLSLRDEATGVPTEQWSRAYRFVTPRNDKDMGVLSSSNRRFRSLETLIRHFEGDFLRSVAQQLVLHERACSAKPDGDVPGNEGRKKGRTAGSDRLSVAKPARGASSGSRPWRSLAQSNRDAMAAGRGPVERLAGKSAEKIVEMAQRGALSYTELLSIVSAQYGMFSRDQLVLLQRALADHAPRGRVSPFVVHASTKGQ